MLPSLTEGIRKTKFYNNLLESGNVTAKQLAGSLFDNAKDRNYYLKQAHIFLQHCQKKLNNRYPFYIRLLQTREEVKTSEISANPLGQILEPGFRVIFPETRIKISSHSLSLDHRCILLKN